MLRIKLLEKITENMGLSIIEVDHPTIRNNFDKRFQVALVVDNKNFLPLLKKKFEEFETSNYLYLLKSDITGENVQVDEVLYHEKQICDKSYEECTTELTKYLAMYNTKKNFRKEMKKIFAW